MPEEEKVKKAKDNSKDIYFFIFTKNALCQSWKRIDGKKEKKRTKNEKVKDWYTVIHKAIEKSKVDSQKRTKKENLKENNNNPMVRRG